jgi:hypothetical protein
MFHILESEEAKSSLLYDFFEMHDIDYKIDVPTTFTSSVYKKTYHYK